MKYSVYIIAYSQGPSWRPQYYAVAVSGSSKEASIKRLKGNREANILWVEKIKGREPEYAQERIEGTVDLRQPMENPPQAGSRKAEEINSSNAAIISARARSALEPKP